MAASPDLIRNPEPAWRLRARAFWRWWSGELAGFARDRFGGLVEAARAPFVSLEGEALVLLERRGERLEEVSRLQMATFDPEGRRKALAEVLTRAGEDARRVRLVLARHEALLRRVALPLATEENLAQVLAFEMDRLTPFNPDDVYFGHRVASRDNSAEKVLVDLVVARRDLVDGRMAELAALGAVVHGVVLHDDAARNERPIDLMPERRADGGQGDVRLVRRVLVGAVLALGAVALALPLWQKRETVIALLPLVEKSRVEAEATGKLANELERLTADYNFLLTRKHLNPPVLAYVEEMSRLLPDQTWVSQLDLRSTGKARELQIQGETASSSRLIELLQQSTLVQNAAPRGTVTRGMLPNTERFLIAAEAKAMPLPERLDAASLPVPVAPAAPAAAAAPVAPVPAADAKPPPKAAEVKAVDPKAAPAKAAPATPAGTPAAPPKAPVPAPAPPKMTPAGPDKGTAPKG